MSALGVARPCNFFVVLTLLTIVGVEHVVPKLTTVGLLSPVWV